MYMSEKCKRCYYGISIHCENCIESDNLKNNFVQRFDYLPIKKDSYIKYDSLSALFEAVAILHSGKFGSHNLVIRNKVLNDGLNELKTFVYGDEELEEAKLIGYINLYGLGEELETNIKDKYVFPVVKVDK